MSVELPIYINQNKIGHLEVTRKQTGSDGVHRYQSTLNLWYRNGVVETFAADIEHAEADGVLPLIRKAFAAVGVSDTNQQENT